MQRDYYEVLGVEKSSDQASIKKAYRKLAMKFHPDQNPGDSTAEDKFKEAAQAYETLSDPQKRSSYDQFGHDGPNMGFGGQGQGFHDVGDIFDAFGDIFGDVFGGGGGGRRSRTKNGPRRGADLRYHQEITLKEVITGTEKEIEFDTESECEICTGSGAEKGTTPVTCSTCGGSGQVIRRQGFFQMAAPCSTCSGQGQIIKKPCKPCHGSGRVSKKKKIKVTIPHGVDNGTQLRLTNEGEPGFKGGPAGDLYVEMRLVGDPEAKVNFQRQGPHIYSSLKISYLQALLGAEIEVETIDGTTEIDIPKGSQSGEVIKVSGEGLPSLRSTRRGNMILELEVEIPQKLAKKEEELLREIAKLKGEEVHESVGLFGFGKK